MLVIFNAKFLMDRFCAFLLEHSATSKVVFSQYSSAFLSDLSFSYSKIVDGKCLNVRISNWWSVVQITEAVVSLKKNQTKVLWKLGEC